MIAVAALTSLWSIAAPSRRTPAEVASSCVVVEAVSTCLGNVTETMIVQMAQMRLWQNVVSTLEYLKFSLFSVLCSIVGMKMHKWLKKVT